MNDGVFGVFGEAVRGELGVVWDVGGGEFELGFLLERGVGGGNEGAEGVLEILLVILVDGGGERLQGGEDGVRDC